MNLKQRVTALAITVPLTLGGVAVFAAPANAAENKASHSQSVQHESKQNNGNKADGKVKDQQKAQKLAELKAEQAEFKSLIKGWKDDRKKPVSKRLHTDAQWKVIIHDWLKSHRGNKHPVPVTPDVEAPVEEAPQLPSDPVVVGPIDSPTRPPIQVGG